jgi:putative transposase
MVRQPLAVTKRSPSRYFTTRHEIIWLAVMPYIHFPLSLRNVEDLLHERGIEISHETVQYWWNCLENNRINRLEGEESWVSGPFPLAFGAGGDQTPSFPKLPLASVPTVRYGPSAVSR